MSLRLDQMASSSVGRSFGEDFLMMINKKTYKQSQQNQN